MHSFGKQHLLDRPKYYTHARTLIIIFCFSSMIIAWAGNLGQFFVYTYGHNNGQYFAFLFLSIVYLDVFTIIIYIERFYEILLNLIIRTLFYYIYILHMTKVISLYIWVMGFRKIK